MPFNQILAKKLIGTAVKDGATVTLSVATKTTYWTRPDFTVDKVGTVLSESFSNWKEPLPNDTQEICSRESDHTSDADARDHLTVVCLNSKGEATTRHVPVTK